MEEENLPIDELLALKMHIMTLVLYYQSKHLPLADAERRLLKHFRDIWRDEKGELE